MRNLAWMLVLTASCGVNKEVHQQTLDRLAACEAELQGEKDRSAQTEQKLKGEKAELAAQLSTAQKEVEELRKAREQIEKTFRDLKERLKSAIAAGRLDVEIRKGRLQVKLAEKVLFDTGRTDLKDEGESALVEVAQALKDIPDRDFLIAGHTDNVPIKTRKIKSNWQLSTLRAVRVVQFMQEQGVEPVHLGAAGFSEYDPVGDNATEEGKALNRRIEIIIMPNIEEIMPNINKELSPTS